MGVPKLPENGISWALYVGDFLLEGVSQWTPCPNGPQSPLPIIKDKTGRIDRMDNYRPIALASAISKVVEIILLNRISKLLSTCSNQFGFQQKLGTDTCIYILRDCGKV